VLDAEPVSMERLARQHSYVLSSHGPRGRIQPQWKCEQLRPY